MKKSIFVFCAVLTLLGLTAFGYMNWSDTDADQQVTPDSYTAAVGYDFVDTLIKQTDTDLVYKVDSRFIHTLTKENLDKAQSIVDILPQQATQSVESYQRVKVAVLHDNGETSEIGKNDVLNPAQLTLLQSTDYSTHFFIKADYKRKNAVTGELENDYLTYYITIVPEKEAEFKSGHDTLIAYLKEKSKDQTAIIQQDQLQPGKVCFTITQQGTIENVKLMSTSGYPTVDESLIELIRHMPENWNPATNSKGEKVDQELVFFFGLEGC